MDIIGDKDSNNIPNVAANEESEEVTIVEPPTTQIRVENMVLCHHNVVGSFSGSHNRFDHTVTDENVNNRAKEYDDSGAGVMSEDRDSQLGKEEPEESGYRPSSNLRASSAGGFNPGNLGQFSSRTVPSSSSAGGLHGNTWPNQQQQFSGRTPPSSTSAGAFRGIKMPNPQENFRHHTSNPNHGMPSSVMDTLDHDDYGPLFPLINALVTTFARVQQASRSPQDHGNGNKLVRFEGKSFGRRTTYHPPPPSIYCEHHGSWHSDDETLQCGPCWKCGYGYTLHGGYCTAPDCPLHHLPAKESHKMLREEENSRRKAMNEEVKHARKLELAKVSSVAAIEIAKQRVIGEENKRLAREEQVRVKANLDAQRDRELRHSNDLRLLLERGKMRTAVTVAKIVAKTKEKQEVERSNRATLTTSSKQKTRGDSTRVQDSADEDGSSQKKKTKLAGERKAEEEDASSKKKKRVRRQDSDDEDGSSRKKKLVRAQHSNEEDDFVSSSKKKKKRVSSPSSSSDSSEIEIVEPPTLPSTKTRRTLVMSDAEGDSSLEHSPHHGHSASKKLELAMKPISTATSTRSVNPSTSFPALPEACNEIEQILRGRQRRAELEERERLRQLKIDETELIKPAFTPEDNAAFAEMCKNFEARYGEVMASDSDGEEEEEELL